MAEENKVTLHGFWASPYSKRVELALKFKGIPFEFVEEDLRNKSSLLLKYNPIHKKVPVLVHNGKPIAESHIILEYIDETWKDNGPKLLPEDPYKRARVRFWSGFLQQQLFVTMLSICKTDGETQEKATEELYEKFEVFEQGMKELFPDGRSTIDSNDVGLIDFVLLSLFGAHKVQSEAVGIKVIDPEKTPLVFSWIAALSELPVVKELTPPHDKAVAFLHSFRNTALKKSLAS